MPGQVRRAHIEGHDRDVEAGSHDESNDVEGPLVTMLHDCSLVAAVIDEAPIPAVRNLRVQAPVFLVRCAKSDDVEVTVELILKIRNNNTQIT